MYRVTVSGWTPTNRAVLRVPTPSATWASTATTLSAGRRASYKGVPFRSEKRTLQVEQRSTRVRLGPYRAGTVRLPWPRFPWSGQAGLRQQKPLRSSMTDPSQVKQIPIPQHNPLPHLTQPVQD